MANLMLHVGASAVDRDLLGKVAMPERTASYVPIGHNTFVDNVQTALEASGLHVVSEAHGLTKDGNRYFGLLHVQNGQNSTDFGLVIGLRNSHDKSFPCSLACGASVFVCDNLSFSGEVKIARKHTSMIERDMPLLTQRAVGLIGSQRVRQEQRFDAYRQTELTDHQAHDFVIRALDSRVLPVTLIPDVLREWRNPSHPEFSRDGATGWRMFNAFTEILKGNLSALPSRTMALHGLLDAQCGLVIPTTATTADTEIVLANAV